MRWIIAEIYGFKAILKVCAVNGTPLETVAVSINSVD